MCGQAEGEPQASASLPQRAPPRRARTGGTDMDATVVAVDPTARLATLREERLGAQSPRGRRPSRPPPALAPPRVPQSTRLRQRAARAADDGLAVALTASGRRPRCIQRRGPSASQRRPRASKGLQRWGALPRASKGSSTGSSRGFQGLPRSPQGPPSPCKTFQVLPRALQGRPRTSKVFRGLPRAPKVFRVLPSRCCVASMSG